MKAMMISLALAVTSTGLAQAEPKDMPEQAAPVYAYVKAALENDLPHFKEAHTKRALDGYEKMGGISNLFDQVRAMLPRKFKGAKLDEFVFTAERQTHATPGSPLELDGVYYTVMMTVEKAGGMGVFVEKEDGNWKITLPKYKNLEEYMKKQKAAADEPAGKAADSGKK